MQLSNRQETILNALIKEYIDVAEPVSSELLKKRCSLAVSPATIRNELQELTEQGYIMQPHTSAGRIPTNKGYRYFVEITFTQTPNQLNHFISKEIEAAKQRIASELELVKILMNSLTEISDTLNQNHPQQKEEVLEILEILGPSRITYDKNIDVMKELIRELENF